MFQSGHRFKNYRSEILMSKRKKISEFIVDETMFKVGFELICYGGLQLCQKTSKFSYEIYSKKRETNLS